MNEIDSSLHGLEVTGDGNRMRIAIYFEVSYRLQQSHRNFFRGGES